MNKILVADDEPNTLRLFEMQLKKSGFELVLCKDGSAVMDVVEQNEVPDLAILDHYMPGKCGLDLIGEFKLRDGWKDIPIIVVTGQREVQLREDLASAGANDVMDKPFSLAALTNRVNELIGASAAAA